MIRTKDYSLCCTAFGWNKW